MLVNSKTFYSNHAREIDRYRTSQDESLHLVNIDSQYPNLDYEKNIVKMSFNNYSEIQKLIEAGGKFKLIVVTDLFELSEDIHYFLNLINKLLENDGKLLITSINPKWNRILSYFEFLKLKNRTNKRNYIHPKKINTIARSSGLELLLTNTRQIFPFSLFGIGIFLNKLLEFLLFYLNFGIKTYSLFRPLFNTKKTESKSIIVPAKNEEGNLEDLINRIPYFGDDQEIVIICGQSKDDTLGVANKLKKENKKLNISVLTQSGKGKANAVHEAIEYSNGELIAILDSDISVDPETLEDFFKIIEDGYCDFVNGTRLIYGKEKGAMRFLNVLGNVSFQFLISIVIKQKLTDSLCGTKVFRRNYLDHLKDWSDSSLIRDPFGDFDFIFSAAYSGQKILEYPVHYRSRTYGSTQISRFRDGWKLLIYFINSLYRFNVSK